MPRARDAIISFARFGGRTKTRNRILPASIPVAIILCWLSPSPWTMAAGAQESPAQSREGLVTPSGLDALSPPPVRRGDTPNKRIERLIDEAKVDEARSRLKQETAARGENHDLLFLEAKLLFKEQRFHESLKVLQRCLALRHDEPRVFLLVASNGLLLDREDIAKPALQSAIRLSPADVLPHFQLGGLYYTENQFQLAAQEMREAVKLKSDFMPAHLFLAAALEELEDRDGALSAYHTAIKLAERQKLRQDQPYLFLGRYLSRLNRHEEGLPYLEKAVEVNPKSSEALFLIGKTLHAQGRDAEAAEALLKSIHASPQYSEPHYVLSRIYHKLGKSEQAQAEFHLFQKLKREEKVKDDGRRSRP